MALDAHVDYIRCQYKKLARPRLIPREVELKAQAQNSRKDTLFDNWIQACLLRPSLHCHLSLLNSLSRSAMSGDEMDSMGPPKVFRIINQEWQSKEFHTFMQTLDSIYRVEWANPHGRCCVPGNAPQTQVVRGKCKAGHAPKGLPCNCYDADWYESLWPFQQRQVQWLEEDYDFAIHANEL
ncbi:hypothetical protein F4604DRAFT_1587163 [Suillus subluteus]|nr:hypothetical protein F4604DRAFT_1587163 [Suillus subluteus]